MKKKSILKLKLKKTAVSALNVDSVKGGFGDSVYLCESENNFCETINATRCYGNLNCGLFQATMNDC
ncbi:hypothetical protein IMCC3317_37470 [Kordia antarctica]|uniref:Uncharacterized protein n=1 Tax=Kordia antarctica TaxID=1218801 RepID=A0A7L4ZP16_9FLAO|nr:hypothetical protein [Kordia antarctica]QHI38355.1 hypothetical protein IMCC3317_37470 [Kordia antarctica]